MKNNALDVQVGGHHYKDMAIQPVEYIHKNGLGFLEGNIVKYISRHAEKGGKQDVEKCIHYCQLLLDMQYPTSSDGVAPVKQEGITLHYDPAYFAVTEEALKHERNKSRSDAMKRAWARRRAKEKAKVKAKAKRK